MDNSGLWKRLHDIERRRENAGDTQFFEFWEVWKKDYKTGTCEHLGTWLNWVDAMRRKLDFENWEDCGERYKYYIRHCFARWLM